MQNTDSLRLEAPSLPRGGGAITGLKGDVAAAGPDGAATLSLPLPVSAGRGYAPALTLGYHSRAGNGPFGMGWGVSLPAVRLRTRKGVPAFDGTDEFTGPDGEVLVPLLDADGTAQARAASNLLGVSLSDSHAVRAYRSRTETAFSYLEYWVPKDNSAADFWVLYSPDGQVHLLGKNAQARIASPEDPAQTAEWLPESSVSMTGEQMYYQYRSEDEAGCDSAEINAHPAATAQRYLVAVWYGNRVAGRTLPALTGTPSAHDWLFVLVMDYGERSADLSAAPDWLAPGTGNWSCRQDPFSGRGYGFDVRTRRLCRQVLMYHAVTALAGNERDGDTPQLVTRLLLTYDENPSLSTLKTVQQAACEPDGSPLTLPPVTFGWQTFIPPKTVDWQQRKDLGNFNLLQPYQMVDLNGDGLAGILYQDGGAWWYRAPVRDAGGTEDAVTWEKAAPLPSVPALRNGGLLADLNGDGYLEWVVMTPGEAGRYDRTPAREWRHVAPLSALPVEYGHPRAQLADITGAGLTDLVLIGPKSVRLYSGDGDGWTRAQTVMQAAGITLPVPGVDARVLVGFSDMDGSGQQHLVSVTADGVRYWPNTGHGRFAPPVTLSGFSQSAATFNPDQLYLADIDGSGTTDLIYALTDRLEVYLNQSGNRLATPFTVALPKGVRYDRTCSLQLADIQGLGVASLILTVPHPVPQHWVCHLSDSKPWLLNAMNNNMGARHALTYRSSAQYWLDEKADAVAVGKPVPASYLPLVLHTLSRTEVTDDITGNRLVSAVRYRHGAWDGREREFRGFGFVEVHDTDTLASQGTAEVISQPAISRSWYATGLTPVDDLLPGEYWRGDSAAYASFTARFTTGSAADEKVYTPDEATAFWLNRGLKGLLLRSELFGVDGSSQADLPYTVTENRPQVRLIEAAGAYPVVRATAAESRTYNYERVSCDPQCSQQVLLSSDEYGQPLRQVGISYPRRAQPSASPYPATLPETLFASSYDEQQQTLRLSLQQSTWHNLADMAEGVWLPGLAAATRSDAFTLVGSAVPASGLTLESLLGSESPLADSQNAAFAGQQQFWYLDADGQAADAPAFPPLQAFTETALLDEEAVSVLQGIADDDMLKRAGYTQSGYLFAQSSESEKTLWTVRQGYATYGDAGHFLLPVTMQDTLLTGAVSVSRDAHDCVITQVKDAAGLTTTAAYDWRFLTPVSVTDANDNVQSITLDALGRLTSLRFSGTEDGKMAGYSDAPMSLPETADAALALTASLPVAQCLVYVPDSWMKEGADKLPPHVVTLSTDRYDSDPTQQIRQSVVFSDGFGRVLQAAARQADGDAWQRADDGSLVAGTDGTPAVAATAFRWAVTGRTEYDNKGQAVRTYQPYFLNTWKYVSDDSARQDLYADTHNYDPVGREWQIKTAKGGLRRSLFTPWFMVSEDENDTASETTNNA